MLIQYIARTCSVRYHCVCVCVCVCVSTREHMICSAGCSLRVLTEMLFNTNYTPGKNLRRSKAPGSSPHIYSFILYFTHTITHTHKRMRLRRSRMRAVCCAWGLIFFCCCSSIPTPRARIVTTRTMTPPRTSSRNVFVCLCERVSWCATVRVRHCHVLRVCHCHVLSHSQCF